MGTSLIPGRAGDSRNAAAKPSSRAETTRCFAAVVLAVLGCGAFYLFSEWLLPLRMILLLAGLGGGAAVFLGTTAKGRVCLEFLLGAHQEVRKVVWPGRPEAMRMTLIIGVLVVIVAIYLWVLDWILTRLLGWLLG